MLPRRPRLRWNDVTHDKLAAHGVDIDRAIEVADGSPKLFHQERTLILRSDGTFRWQPDRVRMIGPDSTGRLLTFILEYPDADGRSHVVTGWPSDKDERSKYRQPGGWQR